MTQTRKCLSLKEKMEVLNDLDKMTQREAAAKWSISVGQVSTIKKVKEKIMSEFKGGSRVEKEVQPTGGYR